MHELNTRRRIEFADTDMGGIVHFSRFMIFMETAEHEFLSAVGGCVDTMIDGKRVGWPRVAVSCEYKSPARFGDVLDIRVRVLRKGTKSLGYGFEIRVGDREVAAGRMTSVCCELEIGQAPRAIPIPKTLADRIEEAPN